MKKTYAIDITIEVEAENQDQAWVIANDLFVDFNGVLNVSEPEEI